MGKPSSRMGITGGFELQGRGAQAWGWDELSVTQIAWVTPGLPKLLCIQERIRVGRTSPASQLGHMGLLQGSTTYPLWVSGQVTQVLWAQTSSISAKNSNCVCHTRAV